LGELLGLKIIVVVNKIDLLGDKLDEKLPKKIAKLKKIFSRTKYTEI
jgi:GTPase